MFLQISRTNILQCTKRASPLPCSNNWSKRFAKDSSGTIATPPVRDSEVLSSTKLKKSKSESVSKSLKFIEYLNKLPILKHNLKGPNYTWAINSLRVKRGSQSCLCMAEEDIAKDIFSRIEKHGNVLDRDGTVIEINPGFGIFTTILKEAGFNNINCFEEDQLFGTELVEKFGVNLLPFNYLALPRLHHADKLDGEGRVMEAFSKLRRGSQKLYVFGATGTSSLINFTIRTLATQKVLFDEGFPLNQMSFYIVIGSKPFTLTTSKPESLFTLYRPSSILFQLLFNYDVLGEVERKHFLPWESHDPAFDLANPSERYRKLRISYDPEKMFLLHFRPNVDVIGKVGLDRLIYLWYFIRHNLYSRKNAIIPQLEQWIPGCGPRLIRQGFTIFNQFGTLTPPQILDLYFQFISWPEYSNSSFISAVEKFQSKMETSDEDVLDFPKPI